MGIRGARSYEYDVAQYAVLRIPVIAIRIASLCSGIQFTRGKWKSLAGPRDGTGH